MYTYKGNTFTVDDLANNMQNMTSEQLKDVVANSGISLDDVALAATKAYGTNISAADVQQHLGIQPTTNTAVNATVTQPVNNQPAPAIDTTGYTSANVDDANAIVNAINTQYGNNITQSYGMDSAKFLRDNATGYTDFFTNMAKKYKTDVSKLIYSGKDSYETWMNMSDSEKIAAANKLGVTPQEMDFDMFALGSKLGLNSGGRYIPTVTVNSTVTNTTNTGVGGGMYSGGSGIQYGGYNQGLTAGLSAPANIQAAQINMPNYGQMREDIMSGIRAEVENKQQQDLRQNAALMSKTGLFRSGANLRNQQEIDKNAMLSLASGYGKVAADIGKMQTEIGMKQAELTQQASIANVTNQLEYTKLLNDMKKAIMENNTRLYGFDSERQTQLDVHALDNLNRLNITQLENASREKVAQLQADTTLKNTELVTDANKLIAEIDKQSRIQAAGVSAGAAVTSAQINAAVDKARIVADAQIAQNKIEAEKAIAQGRNDVSLGLGQMDLVIRTATNLTDIGQKMYDSAKARKDDNLAQEVWDNWLRPSMQAVQFLATNGYSVDNIAYVNDIMANVMDYQDYVMGKNGYELTTDNAETTNNTGTTATTTTNYDVPSN